MSKQNDITRLTNQLKISNVWDTWKQNQDQAFKESTQTIQMKLTDLQIQLEDAKEEKKMKRQGSSLYNIIYLLFLAFIYSLTDITEAITEHLLYVYIMAFGFITFCYFRRSSRKRRGFFAGALPLLCSTLSFAIAFYLKEFIFGDAIMEQFSVEAVVAMPFFEELRKIYIYACIGSAFFVYLISLVKVLNTNRKIKNAQIIAKNVEMDLAEVKKEYESRKEEYEEMIEAKREDYFEKHPMFLDLYTKSEVEQLLEILQRDDVNELDEAIMLLHR